MSYDDVRFLALGELRELLGLIEREPVERLVRLLSAAPRVYTVGAGRSGLAMRGFAMRLMHLGMSSFVVGEPITPALRSGDLLVAGSGTGATESLVVMCEKAKRLGAPLALVTTSRDTPIGRIADLTVEIPVSRSGDSESARGHTAGANQGGGRVVSRQPMATLFEQALWLLLDSTIVMLMEQSHASSEEMFARHANLE